MKTWYVTLPIAGTIGIAGVEAETEQEAIDIALSMEYKEGEHDIEWEQLEHMTEGNCNNFSTNDASAKEE
jgi:hypothetical protein